MFTVTTGYGETAATKVLGVGATLTVFSDSRYWGDGESTYFTSATYLTEKGEVVKVEGVTEASVDATAEVEAAAALAKVAVAKLDAAKGAAKWVASAKTAAKEVAKGRTVKITAKRAKSSGKEGRAFWIGETRWGTRVGFETAEGETVWTAARNLTVTGGNEAALAEVEEAEFWSEVASAEAFAAASAAKEAAVAALAESAFRLAVVASAA